MKIAKLTPIALAIALPAVALSNNAFAQSDLEMHNEPATTDRYEVDESSGNETADVQSDTRSDMGDADSSWSADSQASASQDAQVVYFDFDSTELSDDAKDKLRDLVQSHEEGNATGQLVIKGYTDSTGPDEYNQDLAQRRADAVKEFLQEEGLDSENLQVEAVGEPDDQNLAGSSQENRRVEISIDQAGQPEEIS